MKISDTMRQEIQELAKQYFLELIAVQSTSDEESENCPSTEGQWEVARLAKRRFQELGIEVSVDENGYVFAKLPSNVSHPVPKVGLIAHMDTAPDFNGAAIHPQILPFDGDLALDPEGKIRLSVEQFPSLKRCIGKSLIVTDGSSLLGADDKAGMAAILTLSAILTRHPEWSHGPLRFGMTPDEEIGRGAHRFDVTRFDADVAYTIDGGEVGELEAESFCAAQAVVTCKGNSVHPGSAKDVLINAQWLAFALLQELEGERRPEQSEGRQGFLHLTHSEGDVAEVKLHWILRDFTRQGLEEWKQCLREAVARCNARGSEDRYQVEIRDQYGNMAEVIQQHPQLLEMARKAYADAGVVPLERPIRGGTDGSQLSFKGLPCPNLFTGGGNFHGPYEYLCLEEFYQCVEMLLYLVAHFAQETAGENC